MKTTIKAIFLLTSIWLLASCSGGDNNKIGTAVAPHFAAGVGVGAVNGARVATDYYPLLQAIYVGYFGRPADPGGLAYWAPIYLQAGAPVTVTELSAAYQNSAAIRALIDVFGTSQESKDLYPGDNNAFLTAVYRNNFSRDPDAGGRIYWLELLDSGKITRAIAAFAIMAGAQSTDLTVLGNKLSIAASFTNSLNTAPRANSYSGNSANAVVRTMLAGVTLSTDVAGFQAAIDSTIGGLVTAAVVTDTQAARFLLQAQFSASDAEIADVRNKGYAPWLKEQMESAQDITGWTWLDSRGYNAISGDTRYYDQEYVSDRMVWNQLLTARDAVRKRAALALSEQFVVSISGVELTWRGYAMATYWDALVGNAFGSYRKLLDDVTLSMATGKYLNTLGNQKENAAGRQPDENYAREVMQLYTIGLYKLNLDGSEQVDGNGAKIETYTANDVSNLARVFTGYNAPATTSTLTLVPADNGRSIPGTEIAKPMRMIASQHSMLEAKFLGTTIPTNTDPTVALKTALDTLFLHPNAGPFLARQMIQRLVTSNPSPQYIARVASAFNNNGSGVRGDLKAVFSAILLDDEARTNSTVAQSGYGKLREPIVRLVQWARTFADVPTRGQWKLGDLSNPATQLAQSPLHAPSVFNFFRPGYVPPQTAMAVGGKVAPEFQIVNESTVGGYLNFMQDAIRLGIYTSNSDASGNTLGGAYLAPQYAAELALVTDPVALLARLNLLLCAGRLSSGTQTLILQTLNATPVTAASSAGAKLDRVALAVFLVMASPDYLVQK